MKKFALGVMLLLLLKPLLAQHNYANALHLTTRFLGAQRCGASDSWLHGNCHLADGQTVGTDLTGGWHDCGDHIKFSHTAPFTAAILLLNYVEYSAAYADQYSPAFSAPPANGKPDILDEIKYETDFLIKSLYNNTVYYSSGSRRHPALLVYGQCFGAGSRSGIKFWIPSCQSGSMDSPAGLFI